MSTLAVVGAQWGDEGKGKLVDYLTSGAEVVVRFQGGNNAGHTLLVDGVETKLHLVPSGILRPESVCCIAAGVVVNPQVLQAEIEKLEQAGVKAGADRLVIDRDAHLILPYHEILDKAREEKRGDSKIGTTGRGIGPAYEDRASRNGVRAADLAELETLRKRLSEIVEERNLYLKYVLQSPQTVQFEEVWKVVETAAEIVLPRLGNVSLLLDEARKHEKRIVFEGAQGTLLDQVHGTLPYVTSSNTIAGAALTGCGIGPGSIDYVLGVAKAYCTRVGGGPFPTEVEGEMGELLRTRGGEFGTTTGRARRCGWFDAVAMKRAVRLNGMDGIALTKLDVLSGIPKIKVCIKYHLDGEKCEDVPALFTELDRVEPEYVEFDGWEEDISKARKWHHLPQSTRFYVSSISEIIGCPVAILGVGPERSSTLFSKSATFVENFVAPISE